MWSWVDFVNTALASFAGSALTALVAWLIYVSDRKSLRNDADSQAVGRAFEAAAQYCRDLWAHQQTVKQIEVAAKGNAWTAFTDYRPAPPLPAAATIVAMAERRKVRSATARQLIGNLLEALENVEGDWTERVARIEATTLLL